MNTNEDPKKAADWHRADIVAAVRKAGWTLRKLSLAIGLSPNALNNALDRPWPRAERIIAEAIGVTPETIWPSRYAHRNFKPVLPSQALKKS
jgi:Ner family transcriptional regulator